MRRAVLAAIDRKGFIEAAADGFGTPIGSHYVPGAEGYVDTTSVNPYDPEKAKRLLAEAGVKTPLELTMTLPPPPYARQGGEFIAAQLAKVGINVKVQNVEWAQWLSNTYGGPHNYDLTIVSHVEPFDLGNYAKPDYYWGYSNPKFAQVYDQIKALSDSVGGFGHLLMFGQGGFLDHKDTVANITLFAKEVLPRLHELDPEPRKAVAAE